MAEDLADETEPPPPQGPPPGLPRGRSATATPSIHTLLAHAKRLAADAPVDAERVAKAVQAIIRAQSDHADWLARPDKRRTGAGQTDKSFDERRADIARRHAADIARARAEGYERGRGARARGGGGLAHAPPDGPESAGNG